MINKDIIPFDDKVIALADKMFRDLGYDLEEKKDKSDEYHKCILKARKKMWDFEENRQYKFTRKSRQEFDKEYGFRDKTGGVSFESKGKYRLEHWDTGRSDGGDWYIVLEYERVSPYFKRKEDAIKYAIEMGYDLESETLSDDVEKAYQRAKEEKDKDYDYIKGKGWVERKSGKKMDMNMKEKEMERYVKKYSRKP